MATIHKLTKDGSTIFPATITDAIVHPNTGKTLTSMMKDYNVSELFPSEGVDGGNKYNLALAIQVLGTHLTAAEKTGGIRLMFISNINPYPEEEYYLQKNVWSTNTADWGQRFEVGGVIANPSGSWTPGTAEEYIDQQTAIIASDLASEAITRQTVDSNLQTQINAEVSVRSQVDNTQNTKINLLEEAYRGLTESDVVVGPRPSSGQQTNVIYREPDQGHTPPQFYCDYMWYNNAWVLMAQYDNGIDNNPLPDSNNIVKSSGVFNNIGAFDVSIYNNTIYGNLSTAINAVPQSMRVGGLSIKYIQEYLDLFNVVKTEGVTTAPEGGTVILSDPNVVTGIYTTSQISNFPTLPSTLNSSIVYYLWTSGTYTTWEITCIQLSENRYVQYRYIGPNTAGTPSPFLNVDNWVESNDPETKEVISNEITASIKPNVFYKFGTIGSLTLTLVAGKQGIVNEYMFEFKSSTDNFTLTLPNSVKWFSAPNISGGYTYQVSILNNLAIIAGWEG